MKKLMKNKKKGFTLVEIIVVLVILAILAAVAVPSMISFVQDARGKAYAADARVGMAAAQAVVTEVLASGRAANVNADGTFTGGTAAPWPAGGNNVIHQQSFINMIADVDGDFLNVVVSEVNGRRTSVTGIIYRPRGATIQVRITNGETIVENRPAGV